MKGKFARIICMISAFFMLIVSTNACERKSSESSGSGSGTQLQATKSTSQISASQTAGRTNSSGKATGTVTQTSPTSRNDENVQSSVKGSQYNDGNETILVQEGEQNDNEQTDNHIGDSQEPEENKGNTAIRDIDLGGRTLYFVHWNGSMLEKWINEALVNETGTESEKVRFHKMREAEKRFNFKLDIIVKTSADVIKNEFITNALAGLYYADILGSVSSRSFPGFVTNNLIAPIDEYYDFEEDIFRWKDNVYSMAGNTWNGRVYGFYPDFSWGEGIIYNGTFLERRGLPSPAELYEKGRWDWSTFLELARAATVDVNGDGIIDEYGLQASFEVFIRNLVYSNGVLYINFNNEGKVNFGLSSKSQAAMNALNFAREIFNVYKVATPSGWRFQDNKVAMYANSSTVSYTITTLRPQMDNNVGIVPYPKGPDVSDYQLVSSTSQQFLFPAGIKDLADVAYVMAYAFSTWESSSSNYIPIEEVKYQYFNKFSRDTREFNMFMESFEKLRFDYYAGFANVGTYVQDKLLSPIRNGTASVGAVIDSIYYPVQDMINEQLGH